MSTNNVAILGDTMEKFWVLLGGGSKLLQWRNSPPCPSRVAGRFEAVFDEMDGTHNGMMMWKHFGGQKIGCSVALYLCFVQVLV